MREVVRERPGPSPPVDAMRRFVRPDHWKPNGGLSLKIRVDACPAGGLRFADSTGVPRRADLSPLLGPGFLGICRPWRVRCPESPSPGGTLHVSISRWYVELRRRRVFRALLAYGLASFAVLQVVEPVMHGLRLPETVLSVVVVLLGLGFPVTILLAWAFDLKPTGIERTRAAPSAEPWSPGTPGTGGARNRATVAIALVALGLAIAAPGVTWFFVFRSRGQASEPSAVQSGGPSVAVLPFVDESPGRDQEYLADGFAEEILDALARVDGLRVPGRSSSFWFRGRSVRLSEIGRDLRVRTVLEGSLRRDGNRLRIAAKLVDVGNGYQLWSATFDRDATDVFAVQDEIARAVVAALKVRLVSGRDPSTGLARTSDPEVYFQYLVGRDHFRRGSLADSRRAVALFEKVLSMEPGYAPAWAGLSLAAIWIAGFSDAPADFAMRKKALVAAERAIGLAPSLGDGYLARGEIRRDFEFDWKGSRADLERALSLSPASPRMLLSYGYLLAAMGRLPEARELLERATDSDPLDPEAWVILGAVLDLGGDMRAAETAVRRALEISPENTDAIATLCNVLVAAGRPAEALEVATASSMDWLRLSVRALALHDLGDSDGAREALAQLIARHAGTAAYQVAEVQAHRGDRDAAFAWLDRARAQRDSGLVFVRGDPLLRALHEDARWQAFLSKMGL